MTNTLLDELRSGAFQHAALTTLWLTFAAQGAGTLGGILLLPARMSRRRVLRSLAALYLLLFRGTPELLQLIAWYAILPLAGVNLSIIEVAIIGLAANEVARMVEIIRAAILDVNQGQYEAARVLGLSPPQMWLHIIAPQAARTVLAGLGNEINIMFKTTALVSVIGMTELLRQSQLSAQTAANSLNPYLAAMIYYLAMTTAWGACQALLARPGKRARPR